MSMNRLPFEPYVPRRAGPRAGAVGPAPDSDRQPVLIQESASVAALPDAEVDPPCTESPGRSDTPTVCERDAVRNCDPAACADRLRAEAIRLAASACALALKTAIARNPMFVARFVDDALQALRSRADVRARLHPRTAAACAAMIACEVLPDGSLGDGDVVVEAGGSSVRATIDERSLILVRRVADG
jgi:hypothetical protein